jgi:tRNA-dihydrouridine synthase
MGIKIGNIDIGDFPLLLAPMEDVSDPPFRAASNNFGAYELSLVYNIKNKSRNTNNISKRCPSYL